MACPRCFCNPPCGFPPCEECDEDHGSSTFGTRRVCRDCALQLRLDSMTCKQCGLMKYRTDDELSRNLGGYLWGVPCQCAALDKPPSSG